MKKEFEFEDGGKATFVIDEMGLTIVLQAVHLGKELKITSTQAILSHDKAKDLVEWARTILENPNVE